MGQLSIFEFLDDTFGIFQNQVDDFAIIRYHKNFTWELQNRQEWFLYYIDESGKERCQPVWTMTDLTIVRGLSTIEIKNGIYQGKPMKLIYSKDKLVAYEPSTNVYYPAV